MHTDRHRCAVQCTTISILQECVYFYRTLVVACVCVCGYMSVSVAYLMRHVLSDVVFVCFCVFDTSVQGFE